MSGYKKFEFDNFVIEEDGETVEKAVAEPLEPEPASEEPEPVFAAAEIVAEPPVPETRSYTEEELEQVRENAEKSGYEKGYRSKAEETDNQMAGLLIEIDGRLFELLNERNRMQKELEADFMALNRAVLKKLLPQLSEEHVGEILNRFLAENFANFRTEPKLAFYFNPEIVGAMQEQIAKLARINDFEGKISLHKDAALGKADCRIEWENGGVCRSSDKLLEKVDNLLEEKPAEN